MTGKIKTLIDTIIEQRSKGSPFLVSITKAKIAFKGIDPDKFTLTSEDDKVVIDKLLTLAKEMNLTINI